MVTLGAPEVMTMVAMAMVVEAGDGVAEAEEDTAGEGIEVVVAAVGIVEEGVEGGGDDCPVPPTPIPSHDQSSLIPSHCIAKEFKRGGSSHGGLLQGRIIIVISMRPRWTMNLIMYGYAYMLFPMPSSK